MNSLNSRLPILLLIICFLFGCGTDEEEPDGRFPLITLEKLHSEGDYVWFELNADPAPKQAFAVLIESGIQGAPTQNREAGYTWLRVGKSVKQVEFGLALSNTATWEVSVVPLSEANVNDYPLQGTEAAGKSEFPKYYAAAPSTNTSSSSASKRQHRKPIYLDLTPLPPDPNAPDGMVRIPAGEFQMGSTVVENEKPVHTVHLDDFYIDRYEVTNADYKKFVDANPIFSKTNFPDDFHDGTYLAHWVDGRYPYGKAAHPVRYVSWYAALAYARWVGKRLPTEAEWEKAARGGLPGVRYPWGNAVLPNTVNYAGVSGGTTLVGSYPPNRYGLHDLGGNVQEWCLDEYDAAFYESSPREHPIAGAKTVAAVLDVYFTDDITGKRVLRGGSWQSGVETLRVAARSEHMSPKTTTTNIGFRCVRPVDAPVPAPATLKAAPRAGSPIAPDTFLTLTFDAPPKNVRVNIGTIKTAGKTVTVKGPFDPGKLALFVRWGDGMELLVYDVRQEEKIYWTERKKILSANLDGSDIQELVTSSHGPDWAWYGSIVLDVAGGKMYWTYNGKIQRANLDGTNIQDIFTTESIHSPVHDNIALDVAGGKIYWSQAGNNTDRIRCANLDGTNIQDILTGLFGVWGIALDVTGGKIYWTEGIHVGNWNFTGGKIRCANLDGTNIQDILAKKFWYPENIALDVARGKMYWVDFGLTIQRANLDGSNTQTIIPRIIDRLSQVRCIALDATGGKIYWTRIWPDKIQRANLDGTNIQDIFTDRLNSPGVIALNVSDGTR